MTQKKEDIHDNRKEHKNNRKRAHILPRKAHTHDTGKHIRMTQESIYT